MPLSFPLYARSAFPLVPFGLFLCAFRPPVCLSAFPFMLLSLPFGAFWPSPLCLQASCMPSRLPLCAFLPPVCLSAFPSAPFTLPLVSLNILLCIFQPVPCICLAFSFTDLAGAQIGGEQDIHSDATQTPIHACFLHARARSACQSAVDCTAITAFILASYTPVQVILPGWPFCYDIHFLFPSTQALPITSNLFQLQLRDRLQALLTNACILCDSSSPTVQCQIVRDRCKATTSTEVQSNHSN